MLTPKEFAKIPAVLRALQNPRNPQSILNYICGCNIRDTAARKALHVDENVEPLLSIWFESGTALDLLCQPFLPIIRELKSDPATLIEDEWITIEGQAARVLLADQLSRSCFRGTSEAFSYDQIGRKLFKDLIGEKKIDKTLKLPPALLYLLPWALAHSEDISDLTSACEIIDITIDKYPQFKLFEINKKAVNQHRQVLEKFGRYPQRNSELGRISNPQEKAWLADKERLPIWAGGNLSFDTKI